MQTVIFCGGKGTRIAGSGPPKKELYAIGDRPILWHVIKIFATYGHREFIFPLGYRGDLIRRYFLEYERMNRDLCFRLGEPQEAICTGENDESDWQITLVDTGLEDESGREVSKGERVRRVAEYITGVTFLCYDQDGNLTTTPNDVRSVLIQLSAGQDSYTRTLESRVGCRNMGL